MSDFPDGYKPLSRILPPGKPIRTDAEKIDDYWKEQSASWSAEAAKKNARPTTLTDVFRKPDPEQWSYAFNVSHMLPPNDPLKQEAKKAHFNKENK